MANTPLSKLVETYLYDNEGRLQSLDAFPMMRSIYDHCPQRLLLKCSRKTLKSTLLSNIITLNLLRYNFYKMLYVAPQEVSAKYFSTNYLTARFESEPLKRFVTGWKRDDVFEKILQDTGSSVLVRYVKDDATRVRGPVTDHNIYDEIQDIDFNILPIVTETMSLSPYKREIYSGTPLTTDNTIHKLWKDSNQLEWAMKCSSCNHWNTLTEDNDPMKMIRPQGLCCSKCEARLNSRIGQWVSYNPAATAYVGYHLAQPILPFYNEKPKTWEAIYRKVNNSKYSVAQVYNEVFGLAYDTGSKPITESDLRSKCVLGSMWDSEGSGVDKLAILKKNRGRYGIYTCGADWGVNMETSRTSVCLGALRDDMVYEVFFMKTFTDHNYEKSVYEIAEYANAVNAFCASDAGPSPDRGIKLMQLTSPMRTQLVRYEPGKFIQRVNIPAEAIDPTQNRWCLHRSDTFSLMFKMLKAGRILFPAWTDSSMCLQDILNVYIEVKDGLHRQDLFYRHKPDMPDDFMHALNFAVCQALVAAGDPLLFGPSSSQEDY